MNAISRNPPPDYWQQAVPLIPGRCFTPPPAASPRVFSPVRALWLAAECLGLKAMLIAAQTHITALEEQLRAAQAQHSRDAERIADLTRRNADLTRALHRTACAG